jgi:hypothetical protein
MGNHMGKITVYLGILFLGLFLLGCAGQSTTAQVSHGITYTTGVGAGAQNIAALPAAKEGQPYAATVTPQGGTPPYVCSSVPAGSTIINDIRLNANCTIVGTAPILPSGTTHAAYPVKFMIADANGVVAGPFDLVLEVVRSENQGQGQQGGVQQINPNVPTLNLPSRLPNATVGKEYNYTLKASGGTGPYMYSLNPRWDISSFPGSVYFDESNDGILHIHLNWINETAIYPLSLCVYDAKGNEGCENTSLTVTTTIEEWTGTFQTSRDVWCDQTGAGAVRDGKLAGSWTVTITTPTSLVDTLALDYVGTYWSPNVYGQPYFEGKWSGSESVTKQCTEPKYGVAVPGSVSDLPTYVHVSNHEIDLGASQEGEMMLTGGYSCSSCSSSGAMTSQSGYALLNTTSISDAKISGTVSIYEYTIDLREIGTFTLTKVK